MENYFCSLIMELSERWKGQARIEQKGRKGRGPKQEQAEGHFRGERG